MDLKELLIKLLGKAYNKSADEVSSLLFKKEGDSEVLKDESLDTLYDLDKARVKTFEDDRKVHYDKGYNKAKAETLGKREKELREKFAITEEKQGDDLIETIIADRAKATNPGEPTEDQVKRSKTYLQLLEQSKAERELAAKEWKDKYDSREKQLSKENTLKAVSEKFRTLIEGLNPILPEDKAKAENQIKMVLSGLVGDFEFEVKDDGKIVILKKDGDSTKVFTDDHGHPVNPEALVKERASQYWNFKEGENRSGTGNKNDNNNGNNNGNGNKGYSGPIPKNEAEYMKMLSESGDDKARVELTKVWVGAQKQASNQP